MSAGLEPFKGETFRLASPARPLYRVCGLTCSVFTQENVSDEILMFISYHSFVLSALSLNLWGVFFVVVLLSVFFFFNQEAFIEKITKIVSLHMLIFNILN